jgi:C4-type Zn-finger protein
MPNRIENKLNTIPCNNCGYKNTDPSIARAIDTSLTISAIVLLLILLVIEK